MSGGGARRRAKGRAASPWGGPVRGTCCEAGPRRDDAGIGEPRVRR